MDVGRIVITAGASVVLEDGESEVLLNRHRNGDYGNMSHVDACINDFAVEDGGPVRSAYRTRSGHHVVIITAAENADGQRTTKIALPQELYDETPKRS